MLQGLKLRASGLGLAARFRAQAGGSSRYLVCASRLGTLSEAQLRFVLGPKNPTSALRRNSASSCPQLLVRVFPKDCALDHAANEVVEVLNTCIVVMYVDTCMHVHRYVGMYAGAN